MIRTTLFLFALIGFGSTNFTHAQTVITMENKNWTQEQQEVLNTIEKMTDAFHHKNVEEVLSCYESNAVVVFEPESPISDRNTLKEMFQAAFTLSPTFTYSGHEVFINGNIATHFSPWTMTGKAPDGTEIRQSGLSVAVLRKQANGNWLMIFDNPHGQYLMSK